MAEVHIDPVAVDALLDLVAAPACDWAFVSMCMGMRGNGEGVERGIGVGEQVDILHCFFISSRHFGPSPLAAAMPARAKRKMMLFIVG